MMQENLLMSRLCNPDISKTLFTRQLPGFHLNKTSFHPEVRVAQRFVYTYELAQRHCHGKVWQVNIMVVAKQPVPGSNTGQAKLVVDLLRCHVYSCIVLSFYDSISAKADKKQWEKRRLTFSAYCNHSSTWKLKYIKLLNE